MTIFGYARVSTLNQNLDSQKDLIFYVHTPNTSKHLLRGVSNWYFSSLQFHLRCNGFL